MFHLYKLIGSIIVPPGLFVLLLLLLAAVACKKPRRKALAAALVVFASALYLMSTSAGALLVTGPLETLHPRRLPPKEAEAAIIVLAGGSSYDDKGSSVQPGVYAMERLYAAVRLAKSRRAPTTLILSGGDVFGANDRSEAAALRDAARAMGCTQKIITEDKSRTTAENLQFCSKLIKSLGINHAIIVTNAFHIPRSMQNAARFMPYTQLYPYPSGRLTDPVIRGLQSFLPNAGDLNASCFGIKEWTGLAANALAAKLRR
ncbi:MAG: YdcF family protein [Cloacibacillus sp.]